MAAETQELAILVRARDLASKTLGKVNKNLSSIGRHARRGVGEAITNLKRLSMVGVGVAAALGVGALKFASDWETAAAGVRKTLGENVEGILSGIRDMSRRMPVAATELAGIAQAAGALGVAKRDVLSFTEAVARLSVSADDVTFEAGAESLGYLKTTLGLAGKDFERVTNAVSALGTQRSPPDGKVHGMGRQVAGASKLVGLAKDETLGWAAALANTGEQVEAGGSSLQRFFLGSFKAVGKGGKALGIYAKTAGMSGRAFKRTMDKDFSGAMEAFVVGLGKLDEHAQTKVLEDLGFTDIRITRALLSLTGNTDNLTGSLRLARKAWRENNAATKESNVAFATFEGRLATLRNILRDVGVTIGTEVLPHVSKLVTRFNDWLNDPTQRKALDDLAKKIGPAFESLIADAERFAGTIDWESLLKTARDALSVGQQALSKAFELFNSAPDWLKTAIITGWGLNKLTGGAFGSIVGELGKGLIKGVLGITAGVVNVIGKSIVGPGGTGPVVTPGPGGKTGGGLPINPLLTLASIPFLVSGDASGERLSPTGHISTDVVERLGRIDQRLVELRGQDSQNARDNILVLEAQREALIAGNVDLANRLVDGTIKLEQIRAGTIPELQAIRRNEVQAAGLLASVRNAITALQLQVHVAVNTSVTSSTRDASNQQTKLHTRTQGVGVS